MRTKRQQEAQNKERHRQEQQAAKARRRGQTSVEPNPLVRAELPLVLIVCDGKNTEPDYFGQLRLRFVRVKTVGEGYNTTSLVERAVQLQQEADYAQVWVVFDRDSFEPHAFHEAIRLAEKNGFGVAWSNQSFEYWLILHFEDHQGGGMNRKQYGHKINGYIVPEGAYYDGEGSKHISADFFTLLESLDPKIRLPRKELAIRRARRNHDFWLAEGCSMAEAESCTLVYKLIIALSSYS